jgi:phosphomannomutase
VELQPGLDVDKLLLSVKQKYAGEQITDIDGVKIDFADSWVHLRKSNTEPIVRVYSEAATMDKAEALAQSIVAVILDMIK